MSSGGGAPECGRPDLAQRLANGEELSGAFGAEIAAHAAGCTACSVRLSLVQQAQRWLHDQVSSNRAHLHSSTPCPAAEDLYDFGRGPGAQTLAPGLDGRIQAHLVECAACRDLVATLVGRPPLPLILRSASVARPAAESGAGGNEPVDGFDAPPAARRAPRKIQAARPVWTFAAAAGLALAVFAAWKWQGPTLGAGRAGQGQDTIASAPGGPGAEIRFPTPPTLRGDSAPNLHYPFGNVLAAGERGTFRPLRFEFRAQADAAHYDVSLARVLGGFGRTEPVAELTGVQPGVELASDAAARLEPGTYVWSVVAIDARGQRRVVEEKRFFDLIDSAAAREHARALTPPTSDAAATAALEWLWQSGYHSDARSFAGDLPEGAARNAFLLATAIPGR